MKDELELFLEELKNAVVAKDKLHFKKISENLVFLQNKYSDLFEDLLNLLKNYFEDQGLTTKHIIDDYLRMVGDMRSEGRYFYRYGKYKCPNEQYANINIYSKPEIMRYYMNALIVSQLLWRHHFEMYIAFKNGLNTFFEKDDYVRVLDVGSGHGFFSYILMKEFVNVKIDIVDISAMALEITKRILMGFGGNLQFYNQDIYVFNALLNYDLIILGEVLEHLDDPKKILMKLSQQLAGNGILWITAPTNSPAIDHVYLFRSKEEILNLIDECGLQIIDVHNFWAENINENFSYADKITNLVGVFCKLKSK